jgi:hypothetical protein
MTTQVTTPTEQLPPPDARTPRKEGDLDILGYVEYDNNTGFMRDPNGWCVIRKGVGDITLGTIEEALAYCLGRYRSVPNLEAYFMDLWNKRQRIIKQAHTIDAKVQAQGRPA